MQPPFAGIGLTVLTADCLPVALGAARAVTISTPAGAGCPRAFSSGGWSRWKGWRGAPAASSRSSGPVPALLL